MKRIIGTAILAGIISSVASAQSITTLFNSNNGGGATGGIYFDVTVKGFDLTITGFDTSVAQTGPTFGWSVWTIPGTHIGNLGSNAGWTRVATGNGVAAGLDTPSVVTLDATFDLQANTSWGMGLFVGANVNHRYSGTGTDPAPGALQYDNADVTLDLGSATNTPWDGAPFSPRIWNGTMYYDSAVPEPGSMIALGLGASALLARRRRKKVA